MNRYSRYRIAFQTILMKEILRFARIWVQTVLPPVITTSLYYVIFGNLIGERIGDMDGVNYIDLKILNSGLYFLKIKESSDTGNQRQGVFKVIKT